MLAVTGSKGETSVSNKLHDNSDYVLIRKKPQQLAGKTTVLNSVISCSQIDKYSTGLFSWPQKNSRCSVSAEQLNPWLAFGVKTQPTLREQWINNWIDAGVDKPLENLVGDTEQKYRR